jgi:hypothetical protein
MGCVAGHEFFSTTNRHCTVTPCAPFATVEGSWNEQREQRLGNPCVECPSLNGADNMQAAFTDASITRVPEPRATGERRPLPTHRHQTALPLHP